jgi:hypothetical protein
MKNLAPAGLAQEPNLKPQKLKFSTRATDTHALPPTPTPTPTKNKRIATTLTSRSLNRFEAEGYSDHCLNTTIAILRNKFGIVIDGKRETVPGYHDIPTSVVRYSIAPENLEAALKIIERMR